MAMLEGWPVTFVGPDGREVAVNHTGKAAELMRLGFVRKDGIKQAPKTEEPAKQPEIVVEVGVDAFSPEAEIVEEEDSLDDMTKAELLKYAAEHGLELKSSLAKADVLKACKEIEEG